MKQTTWIDLTDLFAWRGNFTGIQRVAYNYGLRYSKEGARFFIYSSYYKKFVETPFEIVEGAINQPSSSLKKKVKKNLRSYYEAWPKTLQEVSEPAIRKSLHWYRKFLDGTVYKAGRQRVLKRLPTAKFKHGDKVIILGAGWNKKNFIEKVISKKAQIGFELVVHLNDILPIYQPHLFARDLPDKFRPYTLLVLKNADKILTISQTSKKDITNFCRESGLATIPVEVVRLGEDITAAQPVKPAVEELEEKYILSVGTFEIRKNYMLLYQAVKLAQIKKQDLPQIVIAGRKGWLTEDLEYLIKNDSRAKERILHLDNSSDENLAWLYKNCLFTVFPSICEGWGLPIAESLHYGKFCLSSNVPPMPDIAGDLIDYFSPFDAKGCLAKLVEYSSNPNKLESKTAKIKKTYRLFTWDDSFKDFKQAVA